MSMNHKTAFIVVPKRCRPIITSGHIVFVTL